MVVNGAVKWDDIAHLREHLPDAVDMKLLDDQALLALQGPKAVEILTALGIRPEFDDIVPVDRLVFMQAGPYLWGEVRSEEHTSELQSLMRISYVVFCLKKKKKDI